MKFLSNEDVRRLKLMRLFAIYPTPVYNGGKFMLLTSDDLSKYELVQYVSFTPYCGLVRIPLMDTEFKQLMQKNQASLLVFGVSVPDTNVMVTTPAHGLLLPPSTDSNTRRELISLFDFHRANRPNWLIQSCLGVQLLELEGNHMDFYLLYVSFHNTANQGDKRPTKLFVTFEKGITPLPYVY